MKLLRVTTIQSFSPHIDKDSMSYETILDSLRSEALLYPSGFKKHMEQRGWEVLEVLPSQLGLQKKWAKENNVQCDFRNSSWREQLFLKQLELFQPSVLYFERGSGFAIFSDSFRRSLKQRFPFLKAVVGTWGTADVDCNQFRDIDLMLSIDPVFDRMFKNHKIPSEICYHCFDEELIHSPPSSSLKKHDFVFLGVSGYGYSDHQERYHDLIWLLQHSPLEIWCDEINASRLKARVRKQLIRLHSHLPTPFLQFAMRHLPTSVLTRLLHNALLYKMRHPDLWYLQYHPLKRLFPHRTHHPLFGLPYFHTLRNAKVVLNRHIDAKGHYGNMRVFEVCGMGSCLLTDRGQEMKPLFEPDREIATYSSREECLEKMGYLLSNESTRNAMAQAAHQRALKDHTFARRSLQIDQTLRSLINVS